MSWRSDARVAWFLSAALALSSPRLRGFPRTGRPRSPMTLADCVKEALANNPGLRADAARTSAFGHAADAARAARLPRIDLSSDYSYSDRPQRHVQPSYQGEDHPLRQRHRPSDRRDPRPPFLGRTPRGQTEGGGAGRRRRPVQPPGLAPGPGPQCDGRLPRGHRTEEASWGRSMPP
ncbi:MAG: TolC family protein [Marinilabiliales bacterium]|nr:TolC family protein [Marinilabiliales bacterium]